LAVAAGGQHTCDISTLLRRVECWGNNSDGQLGNNGPASAIPVLVVGLP